MDRRHRALRQMRLAQILDGILGGRYQIWQNTEEGVRYGVWRLSTFETAVCAWCVGMEGGWRNFWGVDGVGR